MPTRVLDHFKRLKKKGGALFSRSRDSSKSAMKRMSELPGISGALETVCREAEPRFVDLGERLQMIYSDASALSQQTLQAAGLMAGDSEEGVLAKVEGFAKASLAELKSCQSGVADNLQCVDAVVDHLGSLHGMTDVIEKIALYLRIVGLNIGVECSRSAESQEMFAVVALDTKTLSEKIIEIVTAIRDNAKSARASQISAHAEISGGANHLSGLTRGAEENVARAVKDIERLMSLSLQAFQKASGHSRKISDQVGEIVVGIQFHDNMSQRIDHIGSSLQYVDKLHHDHASAQKDDRSKTLASAHSVVTLQAAQLGRVIDELGAVYQKNMGAFEEIINEVEKLANSLSVFGSDQEAASSRETPGEDPFTALESALGSLHELLARGRELFDRMRESAGHASETTARLSASAEQVRGISMETHIMALNAIVKAAHLGERGLALEVLAQEVKKLSNQSNAFTVDVNELLASITGSSLQLKERSFTATDDGSAKKGAGASLDEGVGEITRAYTKFKEDSSEVSQRA
ncbi:MAG: methyl-accepting chemotaxis protein, partial [Desulfobacterales bacterium]|nr:methyl-accepting chemotaxis protein [Desulfobacterales bacterium]